MNPDKRRFEPLDTPESQDRADREGWPQFEMGGFVFLRGGIWQVESCQDRELVLAFDRMATEREEANERLRARMFRRPK